MNKEEIMKSIISALMPLQPEKVILFGSYASDTARFWGWVGWRSGRSLMRSWIFRDREWTGISPEILRNL